jgi:hypothetical protein
MWWFGGDGAKRFGKILKELCCADTYRIIDDEGGSGLFSASRCEVFVLYFGGCRFLIRFILPKV